MNSNKKSIGNGKQTKFIRIFNIILLILNFIIGLVVVVLNFSRETYAGISNQIFSPNTPIMDSILLDILLRKEFSIIIIMLLTWVIVKEIKLKSATRRLRLNCFTFAGLAAYNALLLYLIYIPVLYAN